MNFKDFHYTLGKIKADIRSQIARKNPLQEPDTKQIAIWLFEDDKDLRTMRLLNEHRAQTNQALWDWTGEHEQDLQDIGDKLTQLLDKSIEIEKDYIDKCQHYHQVLKTIREHEERAASDLRDRKRSAEARLQHMQKSNPTALKTIKQLEETVDLLNVASEEEERAMADFRRSALREAFSIRFNAMEEFSQKSKILAGFGEYLVDLLDIEPTLPDASDRRPYTSEKEANMILMDCELVVDGWQPAHAENTIPPLVPLSGEVDAGVLTEEAILMKTQTSSKRGIEESQTPHAQPPAHQTT